MENGERLAEIVQGKLSPCAVWNHSQRASPEFDRGDAQSPVVQDRSGVLCFGAFCLRWSSL